MDERSAKANSISFEFDDDRWEALNEAHARPALKFNAPASVLHFAFRCPETEANRLFEEFSKDRFSSGPRHILGELGGIQLKLEKHTEFVSCTLVSDNASSTSDLYALFQSRFPIDQYKILVVIEVEICNAKKRFVELTRGLEELIGGTANGQLDFVTTFKPDNAGAIRFLVNAERLDAEQTGLWTQRLFEMETYRTMSLVGLPVARRLSPELTELEKKLQTLTGEFSNRGEEGQPDEAMIFDELTSLSEKANAMRSNSQYRFSASKAYYDLVIERLAGLDSGAPSKDRQSIDSFVRSRLDPAIATIASTEKRQLVLVEDLSRAVAILRTRIELSLNKGNQELLKSMDTRQQQHLMLAQSVENLSAVAITYYGVGLISYILEASEASSFLMLSKTMLLAILVPVVFTLVWLALRAMRNKWIRE